MISVGFDAYLLKLDGEGNFIWAGGFEGYSSADYAYDIVVDFENNVLLCGDFGGVVDFNPGPEIDNMNVTGGSNAFLIKLDENGNYQWGLSIGYYNHFVN